MSRRRTLHERDAYPTREKRGNTAQAYSAEEDMFHQLYPNYVGPGGRGIIDQATGEAIIERVYARYAPHRRRPRLLMPQYRRKKFGYSASYTVVTHTIWAPKGWLDEGILLHEIAHSLTWKQTWEGHGPEFMRMLIELNGWYNGMDVETLLDDAREEHEVEAPDDIVLGDDPTLIRWIRIKRK